MRGPSWCLESRFEDQAGRAYQAGIVAELRFRDHDMPARYHGSSCDGLVKWCSEQIIMFVCNAAAEDDPLG